MTQLLTTTTTHKFPSLLSDPDTGASRLRPLLRTASFVGSLFLLLFSTDLPPAFLALLSSVTFLASTCFFLALLTTASLLSPLLSRFALGGETTDTTAPFLLTLIFRTLTATFCLSFLDLEGVGRAGLPAASGWFSLLAGVPLRASFLAAGLAPPLSSSSAELSRDTSRPVLKSEI